MSLYFMLSLVLFPASLALDCLVFEKIAFFCILVTDRQTDKQTDTQAHRIKRLSLSRAAA